MNKQELRKILIEIFFAAVVLILPLPLLFIAPQVVVSLWGTGLIVAMLKKRQNPEITASKKFQLFERGLYFQIITWCFAFFFLPLLDLIVFIIPLVACALIFIKKKRENPATLKWVKYIAFHVVNLVFLFLLLSNFPDIGEAGIFGLSITTFVNSGYAVFYIKMERKIPPSKRLLTLVIIVLVIGSMTLSMFPQAGDLSVLQQLFGG